MHDNLIAVKETGGAVSDLKVKNTFPSEGNQGGNVCPHRPQYQNSAGSLCKMVP